MSMSVFCRYKLYIYRTQPHTQHNHQKISIKIFTAIVTHETVFQMRATEPTRCWNVSLSLGVCVFLVIDPVGIETSFRFSQHLLLLRLNVLVFFLQCTAHRCFQFSVCDLEISSDIRRIFSSSKWGWMKIWNDRSMASIQASISNACGVNVISFIFCFDSKRQRWNKIINHLFALSINCDRMYGALWTCDGIAAAVWFSSVEFWTTPFVWKAIVSACAHSHTHSYTAHSLAGASISFHRSTCHIFAVTAAAAFRAKQIDSKFTVPKKMLKFQVVENDAFSLDSQEWFGIQNKWILRKIFQTKYISGVCVLSYKLKPPLNLEL